MPVINAKFSIREIECVVGIRYNQAPPTQNKKRSLSGSAQVLPGFSRESMPTVRDFTLSPRERLASAIASAAIVRDVAALGALVLFGTMLVLILSSADILV
ncbi:hypothetical protein [Pleomorphomonas sp. PLEO]|uniref:hypothetical protein n=1 Tax=Pleomorphomonas sp. PLEO TaxID=3239306 RepID=UPI00351F04D9